MSRNRARQVVGIWTVARSSADSSVEVPMKSNERHVQVSFRSQLMRVCCEGGVGEGEGGMGEGRGEEWGREGGVGEGGVGEGEVGEGRRRADQGTRPWKKIYGKCV